MTDSNGLIIVAQAYNFAALRHETQCRKGTRGEPYINHLAEVAELTALATDGQDPNLVAAAVLHDTIEDTKTTEDELRQKFGDDIADLVMEATDDTSLPKMERKRLQVITAPRKSSRAKILKIADKTSNLRSLVVSPPDWPLERKYEYIKWSREVFAGLKEDNDWLNAEFEKAAQAAEDFLKETF